MTESRSRTSRRWAQTGARRTITNDQRILRQSTHFIHTLNGRKNVSFYPSISTPVRVCWGIFSFGIEDFVVIMHLTSLSTLLRRCVHHYCFHIRKAFGKPRGKIICLAMLIHLYDTIKRVHELVRMAFTCDIGELKRDFMCEFNGAFIVDAVSTQISFNCMHAMVIVCFVWLTTNLNPNGRISLY